MAYTAAAVVAAHATRAADRHDPVELLAASTRIDCRSGAEQLAEHWAVPKVRLAAATMTCQGLHAAVAEHIDCCASQARFEHF